MNRLSKVHEHYRRKLKISTGMTTYGTGGILRGSLTNRQQWCRPKTATRGAVWLEYVDHAFKHAHSCLYDSNMLVKPVYVKVQNKEKAVQACGILLLLIEAYFSFLLLCKIRSFELIQSQRCSKKGD